MNTHLRFRLFGAPQITWRDEDVTGFVSNKARALLIYLAVTRRAHSRDALAELLWADLPATKRANLKKTLSNVRNLDAVTLLEEGRQLVALDLERCWVDVADFEQLADDTSAGDVDALQRAVKLYQGDFLSGFNLSLSYEFEAWALGEQAHLKEQVVAVLRRLADGYAQRQDLPNAISTMRHLLQLEPWREEVHRQLIELLARSGDRSAALAHFEICRERLRAELDVEPGAATLELIAKIRADALSPLEPLSAIPPSQHVIRPITHKQLATVVEFPLVGRDCEWQIIHALWRELTHPHFLCIGGEAGIGKTRLAEELLLVAEAEDALVARTRSHALQGQLAYGPIAEWLRSAPLQASLTQLDDVWLTEIARLLPELLIERPDLPPPQPLRESWQRKRFFDALCHAVASVQGPLLLMLDDLQWTDAETLEWLQYLVGLVEQGLLVVGTVRTDEIAADHPLHRLRQQLQRHDRFTELALAPLDQHATMALATHVTTQALTGEVAERLFHDTAGNPLFVIESLRAIAASEDVVALLSNQRAHPNTTLPPSPLWLFQSKAQRFRIGWITFIVQPDGQQKDAIRAGSVGRSGRR